MIRPANKFDTEQLLDLLRNFRSQTPWTRLAQCDDEQHVRKLLSVIFAGGGVLLVSENGNKITGMIMAIKNTPIWDPNIYIMSELAYWVEPEHRGSTAGYRLIAAYNQHCEKLKEQGLIESYTMSKMANSPDLDYARFGFEKFEETWRR
jgi:N-acetylglutamate synthase-like GNAT family acetyltransferase